MPTLQTQMLGADSRALIRKIQRAIAMLAPMTVELPTSLFTVTGTAPNQVVSLTDLKTAGFLPIGIVSPDGYSFSREVNKESVDAFGYASPVRSDVTTVPRSVSFTPLEKGRKHMFELTLGTDLSGVTQDPVSGEIVVDEPDLPINADYRLIIVGEDGPAADNWIVGKGYHRVNLATTAEEVWGTSGAVSSQLTFDVFTDDEVGTPVRHYIGGTGAVKHKDVLGFTQGV